MSTASWPSSACPTISTPSSLRSRVLEARARQGARRRRSARAGGAGGQPHTAGSRGGLRPPGRGGTVGDADLRIAPPPSAARSESRDSSPASEEPGFGVAQADAVRRGSGLEPARARSGVAHGQDQVVSFATRPYLDPSGPRRSAMPCFTRSPPAAAGSASAPRGPRLRVDVHFDLQLALEAHLHDLQITREKASSPSKVRSGRPLFEGGAQQLAEARDHPRTPAGSRSTRAEIACSVLNGKCGVELHAGVASWALRKLARRSAASAQPRRLLVPGPRSAGVVAREAAASTPGT